MPLLLYLSCVIVNFCNILQKFTMKQDNIIVMAWEKRKKTEAELVEVLISSSEDV